MIEPIKRIGSPVLLLMLVLLQVTPVLARDDDLIQREIEAQIAESTVLRDTQIRVQVEERLVVLTGQVRFYEQKLISDRIAWTTPGVREVDNELQVKPKLPLSDAAIERKIRDIVKVYQRFHSAEVVVGVDNGVVSIQGSFSAIGDPVFLKHKVAEIEGVLIVNINAAFLAHLSGTWVAQAKRH